MGAVTLLAVLKWGTAKGPYHLSGLLGRVREGGSLGGDISLVEHVCNQKTKKNTDKGQ